MKGTQNSGFRTWRFLKLLYKLRCPIMLEHHGTINTNSCCGQNCWLLGLSSGFVPVHYDTYDTWKASAVWSPNPLSSSLFCSECGGSFGELRFQTETLKASPGSTSTNSFSKNPMKQEHFCPLPATTLTPAGGGAAAPVQDRKTSIFNSNEAAWKTRTVTAAKRTDSSERMSPSSTLRQDEQQIHRNPTNDNQQDNQHFFKLN